MKAIRLTNNVEETAIVRTATERIETRINLQHTDVLKCLRISLRPSHQFTFFTYKFSRASVFGFGFCVYVYLSTIFNLGVSGHSIILSICDLLIGVRPLLLYWFLSFVTFIFYYYASDFGFGACKPILCHKFLSLLCLGLSISMWTFKPITLYFVLYPAASEFLLIVSNHKSFPGLWPQ